MTFEEFTRLSAPRRAEHPVRLVDGGRLPRRRPDATELYDALSEVLRTRPQHAGEAYGALREADRLLSELDRLLRRGEELPAPWRLRDDAGRSE